jgi:hypothetical protein
VVPQKTLLSFTDAKDANVDPLKSQKREVFETDLNAYQTRGKPDI